jgi:hypothetical protein
VFVHEAVPHHNTKVQEASGIVNVLVLPVVTQDTSKANIFVLSAVFSTLNVQS